MYPLARSLTALCLVVFVVSVSFAGAPESKSQPTPRTSSSQSSPPASNADDSPSADTPAATNINVTIDALSNRHTISSYVYGGAYPQDTPTITDSGLSVVRWGGNSTSRYNWQLFTYNAANDWYFEDFNYSEIGDADSTKFITDVKNAGSHPLMTMVMLPWVAQSAENGVNGHWSFSVAKYGAQCGVDPYNTDAGDGLKTDCSTTLTANPNDANVPLLDQPGNSDPPGSVYRNQWAAALASAFGTAPHFYNMDNEIDIWGGTHRDVHPAPAAYSEMRDTFVTEARALKGWDPKAIRLGPVSCCWWFYWNGADGNDKGAHAGVDLLPWWLNEVYWEDKVAGLRSVDVFDVHAYPDGPDTSTWTQAQKQALAARIYRDYWDPTYVSESGSINQNWATFIQPNKTIPFRIPRIRATANMIYPGTPVSFTEWSAAFAGESDFSTALGDADAYGILGRERIYLASRWTAPAPTNPNYLALKLFTNYDGQHHGFATTSVSDTNNGDPNLFSSYAALNSTGKILTVLVLNKDPSNTVQAQFTMNGFTPQQVTSYTLAVTNPTQIVASNTTSWSPSMTFAPYSATLLVVTGKTQQPGAEWDLNPDTTMVAAGSNVVLQPKVTSGTATVTLGAPQSDSGITVTVSQPTLSKGHNGKIKVTAGTTPGFYHYNVPSTDTAGIAQQQGGYILVGNPPASFTKTGDKQKGAAGSQLSLSVTLDPGQSGGSASGGTVLFTTNAGSLSSRIVTTDSTGKAAVVLTLPSTPGTVRVTAEGQYALGHPVVTFTETAQ
jgi:glycosyl hydrolase family 44